MSGGVVSAFICEVEQRERGAFVSAPALLLDGRTDGQVHSGDGGGLPAL